METEQYLQRQRQLIDRLSQLNAEDFKSKREIIKDLIDATRPLVKIGYYDWPKRGFASYINQQLIEYNIEYPRGESFYNLFEDEEKREEKGTNSESLSEIHKHEFNEDGECECGVINHKGIIYDVAQEATLDKTDVEKNITKEDKPDPFENEYTEYLQRVSLNCHELAAQSTDLIKKFNEDDLVADIIRTALPDIEKYLEEQKGLEAKLLLNSKLSDYRQKMGEWEKLKSIILLKNSKYGIAGVAKLISNIEKCKKCGSHAFGITPKHMSVNIMRHSDGLLTNMQWFRSFDITAEKDYKKGDIIHVPDFSDWYNENIERKILGLEMLKSR